MPALYRQYRPKTFAEVMGQGHVTSILEQAILKDRTAHAYLFQGPRGTGKTTTARLLAKRLSCKDPQGVEACGKCEVCVATQEGRNIDIIEIDAASNRGIDDIRALRENVSLSPTLGRYKVYIIDEVHMLTNEAFAALLKTLEEPVGHAIFILATTELHKVPPTILSRCQVFRFKRATDAEMRERLQHILKAEKREVEDTVLSFIISRSDGCYRDAESLLGQILSTKEGSVGLDEITNLLGVPSPEYIDGFLSALIQNDAQKAILLAESVFSEGLDPEQFIQEMVRVARDGAVSISKQEKSAHAFTELPEAGSKLPHIIRALIQATQDVDYVPQPLIALQLVVLTICTPQQGTVQSSAPQPIQQAAPQPVKQPAPQPVQQTPATPPPAKVEPQPVQQAPVTPKPAPAPVQEAPAPQKPATPGVVSVEQIKEAWPQLIEQIKKTNPVSSTFLRATEAIKVDGSQVVVQVQYPLHRNFFEKAENKASVEKALSDLVGQKIVVSVTLNESVKSLVEMRAEKQKTEDEHLQNVQEVFGVKG